jgi:hypothetical protein
MGMIRLGSRGRRGGMFVKRSRWKWRGAGGVAVLPSVAFWLAAVGLASPADAAQKKLVTEKLFPLPPGGDLRIESQNGRISVETWNRPEASVQITRIARANDDKTAEALLKEMQADVTLSPGRIEIVSRYPKRSESVGFWDILGQRVTAMNIHYHVKVPARTALDLETTNGELEIKGTTAGVKGRTVNGTVEIRSVKGPIEVQTTNGSIRLSGIEGSTRAGTTNGTITAELRQIDAAGKVVLSTTNGNVTASLPANLKATVDAQTTNGRVRVAYPVTKLGGSTARSLHATIGGGGVEVTLRATNGNIVIQKIGSGDGT